MLNSTISSEISHQQAEQIKATPFNLRAEPRDSQVLMWPDQFTPKYSVELIGLNWDLVDCTVQIKLKTKLRDGVSIKLFWGYSATFIEKPI